MIPAAGDSGGQRARGLRRLSGRLVHSNHPRQEEGEQDRRSPTQCHDPTPDQQHAGVPAEGTAVAFGPATDS